MALTATGYDGTVTETDIARMAPNFGPPVVEGNNDFRVTAVSSGADRTVTVAAGAADACFVRAVNTAPINVQSPTLGSGIRWDTVVLRRDWSANTVSIVIVTGTSTAVPAAAVEDTPGVTHDQLLALVQIVAGQQAPASVIDLRRQGPAGTHASSIHAAGANPPLGTELVIAGVRYRRSLDISSNPTWILADAPSTGAISLATGWTAAAGNAAPTWYRDNSGRVYLNGTAAWTGQATTIAFDQLNTRLLGTVPVPCRPAASENGLAMVTATQFPWRLRVNAAGNIAFAPASGSATLAPSTELSLSGFNYQGA